jgi:predicted RNA-binding protein (virulence factor B family)
MPNVGEVALLKIASLEPIGAFLDWGQPKELFLPFAEQTRKLQVGESIVVFIYLDNLQRPCASMRIEKHLGNKALDLHEGQAVELLLFQETDLGFKAAINGKAVGMLYRNEIFQPMEVGSSALGYIKTLRPDGKIDLSLQPSGYGGIDVFIEKILDALEKSGGYLEVTDQSPPEVISQLFGLSKKKYKMALGTLYKQKRIVIEPKGIRFRKD